MRFVPSYQGISHNELEFTEDSDMVAGLSMFTETLKALATTRPDTDDVEGVSA
ncbi:MAG: Zn-dependent hydrolase, partial [Kocuria sp.]|nr:Zn-dependent hydrolase [Kocuria sp.]